MNAEVPEREIELILRKGVVGDQVFGSELKRLANLGIIMVEEVSRGNTREGER